VVRTVLFRGISTGSNPVGSRFYLKNGFIFLLIKRLIKFRLFNYNIFETQYIFLGVVAEWLKALDCKSLEFLYVGSNPIDPIKKVFTFM
jgi:hypothetical protein